MGQRQSNAKESQASLVDFIPAASRVAGTAERRRLARSSGRIVLELGREAGTQTRGSLVPSSPAPHPEAAGLAQGQTPRHPQLPEKQRPIPGRLLIPFTAGRRPYSTGSMFVRNTHEVIRVKVDLPVIKRGPERSRRVWQQAGILNLNGVVGKKG